MKITEENQRKIEKYLAKGFDEQELKEFEALLITDLEFAEMVKSMAKARIAIQQEGDAILKK